MIRCLGYRTRQKLWGIERTGSDQWTNYLTYVCVASMFKSRSKFHLGITNCTQNVNLWAEILKCHFNPWMFAVKPNRRKISERKLLKLIQRLSNVVFGIQFSFSNVSNVSNLIWHDEESNCRNHGWTSWHWWLTKYFCQQFFNLLRPNHLTLSTINFVMFVGFFL